MLKWLVQRVPETTLDVLTDDPLATLHFDHEDKDNNGGSSRKGRRASNGRKKARAGGKPREIYSVNRTNPLYDGADKYLAALTDFDDAFEAEEADDLTRPHEANTRSSSTSSGGTTSSSSGYASTSIINLPPEIIQQQRAGDAPLSSQGQGRARPPSTLDIYRSSSSSLTDETIIPKRSHATVADSHINVDVVEANPGFVRDIDMFCEQPASNSVLDVTADGRFVSSVRLYSRQPRAPPAPTTHSSAVARAVGMSRSRQIPMSPIREVSGDEDDLDLRRRDRTSKAKHDDSIVTDSLLQMTSFSSHSKAATVTTADSVGDESSCSSFNHDPDSLEQELFVVREDADEDGLEAGEDRKRPLVEGGAMLRKNEDMDKVIRELTQAVMNSRNVSRLTRAMKKNGRGSGGTATISSSSSSSSTTAASSPASFRRPSRGGDLRSSLRAIRSLAKTQGVGAVRELWQRTGMKTNGGRKLLVDSLSEEDEAEAAAHLAAHLVVSRSSSNASTSISSSSYPEYQTVFGARNPNKTGGGGSSNGSQYQSDLYADVYRGSSSGSSGGRWRESVSDDADSQNSSQKKVKFSRDVVDNELASSSSAAYPELVVDPRRLDHAGVGVLIQPHAAFQQQWERYYGASGKFAGDVSSSARTNPYRAILNSPYFDYRKAHSTSGSSTYGSCGGNTLDIASGTRMLLSTGAIATSATTGPLQLIVSSSKSRGRRKICNYWKSILTLLLLAAALVAIVVLTAVYASRIVKEAAVAGPASPKL